MFGMMFITLFFRAVIDPYHKQIFILLFQRLSSSKTTKYIKSKTSSSPLQHTLFEGNIQIMIFLISNQLFSPSILISHQNLIYFFWISVIHYKLLAAFVWCIIHIFHCFRLACFLLSVCHHFWSQSVGRTNWWNSTKVTRNIQNSNGYFFVKWKEGIG